MRRPGIETGPSATERGRRCTWPASLPIPAAPCPPSSLRHDDAVELELVLDARTQLFRRAAIDFRACAHAPQRRAVGVDLVDERDETRVLDPVAQLVRVF